MKLNKTKCGFAVLCCLLSLKSAASANPVSTPIAKAPAIQWRVIKAETYTFFDEWYDNRAMRAVKIWISSPSYVPTIHAVIPDDTEQPAHWQLTDPQGNSYVKRYIGLEYVASESRAAKNIHVLEFTGLYIPVPYSKVGQIRLRFPIAFRHVKDVKGDREVIVQCNTIVTHHK